VKLREMDEHVTYVQHLQEDDEPVVLINEDTRLPGHR